MSQNTPSAAPGNGNEQTAQSPEQKQLQDQLKTLLEGNSELNKDIVALFDRMSDDMKKRVNIGDYFKVQSDALNGSKDPVKNLETRQKTTKWLFDLLLWDADTRKGSDIYRTEIAELKGKYEKEVGSVITETRSKVSEAEPDFRTVGTKLLSNLPDGTSLYKVEVDGTDIGKSLLRIVDEKNGKLLHSIPLKGDGSFIGNINEYTYIIGEKPYKISKNGEKYEFKDVSVPLKRKEIQQHKKVQPVSAATGNQEATPELVKSAPSVVATKPAAPSGPRQQIKENIDQNFALKSKLEVTNALKTGKNGEITEVKNLPGVSFIKYETQDDINNALGRITAFIEKKTVDFSNPASWNYAGGHNLSSVNIADYANKFKDSLTKDENILITTLKGVGIIKEEGGKFVGEKNRAIISMFYPVGDSPVMMNNIKDGQITKVPMPKNKYEEIVDGSINHELTHGLYFTNPEFKKLTDDIWIGLDKNTKQIATTALNKHYTNNQVHATEFLSYALFTNEERYIKSGIGVEGPMLTNLQSQIYTTIDAKKNLSPLVKSFFDTNGIRK